MEACFPAQRNGPCLLDINGLTRDPVVTMSFFCGVLRQDSTTRTVTHCQGKFKPAYSVSFACQKQCPSSVDLFIQIPLGWVRILDIILSSPLSKMKKRITFPPRRKKKQTTTNTLFSPSGCQGYWVQLRESLAVPNRGQRISLSMGHLGNEGTS